MMRLRAFFASHRSTVTFIGLTIGVSALVLLIVLMLRPALPSTANLLGDPDAARPSPTARLAGDASTPAAAAPTAPPHVPPVDATSVAEHITCAHPNLHRNASADAVATTMLAAFQSSNSTATPPATYDLVILLPLDATLPPCAIDLPAGIRLPAATAAFGVAAVPDTDPNDGLPDGYAVVVVGAPTTP